MLALSRWLLETTECRVSATLGDRSIMPQAHQLPGSARLVATQRERKNGSSVPGCRATRLAYPHHKKVVKWWLFGVGATN